jgi:hypothetical protein
MCDRGRIRFLTKQAYLRIAKEDAGRVAIVFGNDRKQWMPYWARMPQMAVASDAMSSGGGGMEGDPFILHGAPAVSRSP